MGYFNRFLLFIYSLAIAAVSLGIVVLCLHVLPMNEILNEIKFALSRWETIAAAVFVFFFSVHILGCALSSGSSEGSTRGEMLLLPVRSMTLSTCGRTERLQNCRSCCKLKIEN